MAAHGYVPHTSRRGRVEPFDPARDLPQVFDLLFLKG
jgi:hypothetical protein